MKSTIIRPVPDIILVASMVVADFFGFIVIATWFFILGMPESYTLLIVGVTTLLITNLVYYHVATIRPATNSFGVIFANWLRNKLKNINS